jgi:hypothetical protein
VLGLVAAVLGILALTRMSTVNLIALGVIALGIALWAGTTAEAQLALATPEPRPGDRVTTSWIIGLGVAIGISAIILGILALFGVIPRVLSLISVVGVGVAVLLAGTIVARGVSWSEA